MKLTTEDMALIGRALMAHRKDVEHNTPEGVKHEDFSRAASLADRLVTYQNGAELTLDPPKAKK